MALLTLPQVKPCIISKLAPKRTTSHKQRLQPTPALPHLLTSIADILSASSLPMAAIEIDFSDSDTQLGILGAVLGLGLGIGAPVFYSMRDDIDEERLEELRQLNRAVKEETGEYLTPEEIAEIRTPRWTDRREFVDDD
jgi:hypothetical protein